VGFCTKTKVRTAATTLTPEIAQNAACQSNRPPMNVASGSPSSVPSIRPFITTPLARPRMRSSTSRALSDTPMPKNAWAATPLMIRATTMTE
jgi:hypothetical protein